MFDVGHSPIEGGPIAWSTHDLSKFDDFDRLVLAGLALKSALLRTGPRSIRVSHIGAAHLAHVGCTISCEFGMGSNWRMATHRRREREQPL